MASWQQVVAGHLHLELLEPHGMWRHLHIQFNTSTHTNKLTILFTTKWNNNINICLNQGSANFLGVEGRMSPWWTCCWPNTYNFRQWKVCEMSHLIMTSYLQKNTEETRGLLVHLFRVILRSTLPIFSFIGLLIFYKLLQKSPNVTWSVTERVKCKRASQCRRV